MRAVVIEHPGSVGVRQAPDPTPGPMDIVVAVRACGVCGTDLHIMQGEFPPTPYPIIPGHEFSGEVVEVGASVPGSLVRTGQRVAVDPSLFCGYCPPCRRGQGNLCENWAAIGDTVSGAFAEYVKVPAANAYALPEHLDYRTGALVEPLSCAVHGLARVGDVLAKRVLVVGAGTMGLLLQQLLLRAGAASVTAVDRQASRLEAAKHLGAEAVATDLAELGDERFDICVDATGAPAAIEGAFDRLERGGTLLLFGVANADVSTALSPFRIYNDELTVVGSMAVLHSFGEAVDLLATGAVDPKPLLATDPFPLDGFTDALDAVRTGRGVKVQVDPTA